jgi:hypothetical protein
VKTIITLLDFKIKVWCSKTQTRTAAALVFFYTAAQRCSSKMLKDVYYTIVAILMFWVQVRRIISFPGIFEMLGFV